VNSTTTRRPGLRGGTDSLEVGLRAAKQTVGFVKSLGQALNFMASPLQSLVSPIPLLALHEGELR